MAAVALVQSFQTIGPERCIVTCLSKFGFLTALQFIFRILGSNVIFHEVFLTINGYSSISSFLGQLAIHIFKSAQYICQFNSVGSISSPEGLVVAPMKKLLSGFNPEKF